jgi:ATP/maltotriose-dependent transcriptional regulator MalT
VQHLVRRSWLAGIPSITTICSSLFDHLLNAHATTIVWFPAPKLIDPQVGNIDIEGRSVYHLFAEVLRLRLQRAEPELVPGLHREAALWYAENDLIDDAMHHALEEGDGEWIADLIEQYVEETLQRGEGETLRRWLAAVPGEVVRKRTRLLLAQALVALNVGHLDLAETLLDEAAHTASGEPYAPTIGSHASMLANVPAARDLLRASLAGLRGDAEQSIGSMQRALRLVNEGELGPRVAARWNTALADWMRAARFRAHGCQYTEALGHQDVQFRRRCAPLSASKVRVNGAHCAVFRILVGAASLLMLYWRDL